MSKGLIQFLPQKIIHRIASGQIIHNPSSILKELLENSIDAKANNINIILTNAGKTIIQVIDNGIGMNKNDAYICFKKYATSKIKYIDDLLKIKTKGFRGEALAAISDISHIELITKDNLSILGSHLFIYEGVIKKILPININTGTNLSVKNIFFNLPLRRNFLKSNNIELSNIINEFYKIALAHFEINFKLLNNNKLLFNLFSSSVKDRILNIFYKKNNIKLIPISYIDKYISIKGYISHPSFSKKNKTEQFFFVNRRYFFNKYLSEAVHSAYVNIIQKGYYPSYFIFLFIDNKFINFNIHPLKNQILFEDEIFIYNAIKKSIKLGLYNTNFIEIKDISKKIYHINEKEKKNKFFFKSKQNIYNNINNYKLLNNNNYYIQIYKKYIITYLNKKLVIIDQHRAHKRILYDKYLNINNNNVSKFLSCIKINLSINNIEKIKLLKFALINLGFDINIYSSYIKIINIPNYLNNNNIIILFHELISNFDLNNNKINDYKKFIISFIIKPIVIKRGVTLNSKQIKYLIVKLFLCKNPILTPCGKFIFFNLNQDFLDLKFKK